MGKLGALSILLAVALIIYFFNPNSQVEVRQSSIDNSIPAQSIPSPSTMKPIINGNQTHTIETLEPIKTDPPLHVHETKEAKQVSEIPQFIKDSLEKQRISTSELVEVHHPDGSVSMDLKGQFQHVPVAVIGEDGKVKVIEAKIEPIAE